MQIKTGINKILVVVDSIDIDDSSGSKANVALIYNLHKAGFELKVYHYTQKKIFLANVECHSILEKKWNLLYFLSRLQRYFTRHVRINLNPFLEGFFGFSFTFLNDANSIVIELKKENTFKPDLVLTLSKGASFRPHYALLEVPKLHDKWMAYVHDPFPFHFYPVPYDWFQPGYKQKQHFFLNVSNKAKYSAFPSLLLKEWMGKFYPNFLKTGILIPHQNHISYNKEIVFPAYFDKSKFTLLHAGNLLKQRSPVGLIEGFNLFLKRRKLTATNQVNLLLLGGADYHLDLLDSYQKNIPELVVNHNNIPFDEVYHLQYNVSVNIILESKSDISPFLPGKFPHCVSANKPILLLGPHLSETKRLLGMDYPFVSEADDVLEIANKIEVLYDLWLIDSNLALNRPDLEEYLSANYLKEQLSKII